MKKTRRIFLQQSGQAALALTLSAGGIYTLSGCSSDVKKAAVKTHTDKTAKGETKKEAMGDGKAGELFFKISLAEWSLHRTIFDGKLDHLEFAAKAKNDFGIGAVEYVNQFFKDKAGDRAYLEDMKQRAEDVGVKSLLIMIDGEGNLGDLDDKKRKQAVENHYKWVKAAKFLGCHSIRVNAAGEGSREDVAKAAINGLGHLSEFAAQSEINVIVENHGGYSSDGQWLSEVIQAVNLGNCGTLPDFGNFITNYETKEEYDRYKGVGELMPYAKAVSAKSQNFDEKGNETKTDYHKMLNIVKAAGYSGYVGIEYEGSELPEDEGIRLTQKLLIKAGSKQNRNE